MEMAIIFIQREGIVSAWANQEWHFEAVASELGTEHYNRVFQAEQNLMSSF